MRYAGCKGRIILCFAPRLSLVLGALSCAFPAPLKPSAYLRVRPCDACVAPHSGVCRRCTTSSRRPGKQMTLHRGPWKTNAVHDLPHQADAASQRPSQYFRVLPIGACPSPSRTVIRCHILRQIVDTMRSMPRCMRRRVACLRSVGRRTRAMYATLSSPQPLDAFGDTASNFQRCPQRNPKSIGAIRRALPRGAIKSWLGAPLGWHSGLSERHEVYRTASGYGFHSCHHLSLGS